MGKIGRLFKKGVKEQQEPMAHKCKQKEGEGSEKSMKLMPSGKRLVPSELPHLAVVPCVVPDGPNFGSAPASPKPPLSPRLAAGHTTTGTILRQGLKKKKKKKKNPKTKFHVSVIKKNFCLFSRNVLFTLALYCLRVLLEPGPPNCVDVYIN